ncbi:MAG: amidase family protein [Hyphomicrobiales bacterium]
MPKLTRREFMYGSLLAVSQFLAAVPGMSRDASLAFRTAGELAALLRNRDLSSVELTQYFIDRIERHDKKLNAVVVRDFDRALEAARAADAALARGEVAGPLHGLPMTIKESYDLAGLATTWGDPADEKNIAKADAVVVARLKRAGAHIMGKTNIPKDLDDFQSYNDIYGQTNNPWDVTRTPGGSSGGAAAALAAGMTGLECGSDIGGSIRNPAHYCGVFGHKPSWGVVPSRGHTPPGVPKVPQEVDLAVLGPLARSAEDLALALNVIAGPDLLAAQGWKLALPKPRKKSLQGLRVALWPDDRVAPVDTEIADRVVAVGDRLARLGATVSDSARPAFRIASAHETYIRLLRAIIGSPAGNIDHRTWMRLNFRRGRFREQWREFFMDWDVVLCPVAATTAFLHDHSDRRTRVMLVNGIRYSYWRQVFWAGLATMPYLPATVFPTGLSKSGLPIGLQAIGAEFDDYTTIETARMISHEFGGFRPPEGYGA